jgi:hypothetical protein
MILRKKIINENRKKTKKKKKSDNEKTTKNNISNFKFINITNMKLFKYASFFINKTFNNFL